MFFQSDQVITLNTSKDGFLRKNNEYIIKQQTSPPTKIQLYLQKYNYTENDQCVTKNGDMTLKL